MYPLSHKIWEKSIAFVKEFYLFFLPKNSGSKSEDKLPYGIIIRLPLLPSEGFLTVPTTLTCYTLTMCSSLSCFNAPCGLHPHYQRRVNLHTENQSRHICRQSLLACKGEQFYNLLRLVVEKERELYDTSRQSFTSWSLSKTSASSKSV